MQTRMPEHDPEKRTPLSAADPAPTNTSEGDSGSRKHRLALGAERVLLFLLTLWALAMVVPDLHRLVAPLGSFGLSADNDGYITDVVSPFAKPEASPAYRAGVRPGDRLDLTQMRCTPWGTRSCATAQAILGGQRLVSVGRRAELDLAAGGEAPARRVELVAEPRPVSIAVLATLLLDQLAAIAVVLAAAWLVLIRQGPMTWGFFLYVLWFNPGRSDAFYALLQHSPLALLTQNLAGALAEGAGYAGFMLFALRVPRDEISPAWRPLQRALPAIAVLLALLLGASYANLLGYRTEFVTRIGILSGLVVVAAVFAILLMRRKELPPQDYQRLRWIIYGSLIGLPAIILADTAEGTSLLANLLGSEGPQEEVWGLVRFVNGVLCLLVFEAVRRPRVVTVSIPLRRVTILGILLSVPALMLHEGIGHIREGVGQHLPLPPSAWFLITAAAVFIISRLHEIGVHFADRHFNRTIARAGSEIAADILTARQPSEVEAILVQRPHASLDLVSAALFRNEEGAFRRSLAEGWGEGHAETLDPADPMLAPASTRKPFGLDAGDARRSRLPAGPAQPIFAVPIADRFRCHALALYGEHANGTDLTHDERAMLAKIAEEAVAVLAKLETDALRRRLFELERELEKTRSTPKPA
jgi:hypothetical protein